MDLRIPWELVADPSAELFGNRWSKCCGEHSFSISNSWSRCFLYKRSLRPHKLG